MAKKLFINAIKSLSKKKGLNYFGYEEKNGSRCVIGHLMGPIYNSRGEISEEVNSVMKYIPGYTSKEFFDFNDYGKLEDGRKLPERPGTDVIATLLAFGAAGMFKSLKEPKSR